MGLASGFQVDVFMSSAGVDTKEDNGRAWGEE